MNVNKVILVGRLTRDPELRTTNSGQSVSSVGLATNRYWTDKNGQKQEQTEFHNIVLFGRMAEIAGQYLTKGQMACFEGRLQTRTYTGKDNVERRATEIVAENMQLGPKPQGSGGGGNYSGASAGQSNQTANANQTNSSQPQKKNQPLEDENIPTINLDDEDKEEVKIEDVPF